MRALLVIFNVLVATLSVWWLADAQEYGNDVSVYAMSKDQCKYWVLRKIQETCENRRRRRMEVSSDRRAPLHAALMMGPEDLPPESIIGIPNSWNQDELEAVNRVRRLNLWQLYEKCCRAKRPCNAPTDCTGFLDD